MKTSFWSGFMVLVLANTFFLVPPTYGLIRVDKEGSGGFTVIQDALNSAADGDTIIIGPGRYEDTSVFNNGYHDFEGCAYVLANNVTLLGEDRDSVIIGPDTPYAPGSPHGVFLGELIEAFRIENLTLEGFHWGILISGRVVVDDCNIWGCNFGIRDWNPVELTVNNTEISNCNDGIFSHATQATLIQNCTFSGNRSGARVYGPDILVTGSTFDDERGGIGTSGSGTWGTISNCQMSGHSLYNVAISNGAQITLNDNFFGASFYGARFFNGAVVTGSGNIFEGGELSAIWIEEGAVVSLENNHILPGSAYSVYVGSGDEYPDDPNDILDFQNNYWGTTDEAEVAALIYDNNDQPECNVIIDFQPMADGPLPTEEMSFGSIKAMFR